MLWQEVGVAAQPIAGAVDLDDDGVVQESIQERSGNNRAAKHQGIPLTSKASTSARAMRSLMVLSQWLTSLDDAEAF